MVGERKKQRMKNEREKVEILWVIISTCNRLFYRI